MDFETRSTVDLRKTGLYRYAEDETTSVWGFSYSWGDGKIYDWEFGDFFPLGVINHIIDKRMVTGHNVTFERIIWNKVLRRYNDLPQMTIEQTDCTMARAYAVALPGDLDSLSTVLNLKEKKDREGHNLMLKMSKPKKIESDGTIIWHTDKEMIERLAAYRAQDVRAEIELDKVLPPLTEKEKELWILDQQINDRGVLFDIPLAMAAADVAIVAKRDVDRRVLRLTKGEVKKVSEVSKLVDWLNSKGIETEKIRKGDQIDLMLIADLFGDQDAHSAIELRREGSKTSTAKYARMQACACEDNRIRGMLQYHGASTGRWGGRLVQPQNFPRVDAERDGATVELTVMALSQTLPAVKQDELINIATGASLPALSKSLRGMIIAKPGKRLLGGDFSNIEGRINTWIAGEAWKNTAFRDYDKGVGPDLYKLAYAKSFGVSVDSVTKSQRQIGKVQELALGYQGGVGAFLTMTQTYEMKIAPIVEAVRKATTSDEWEAMRKRYEKAVDKKGLFIDHWIALKIVVTNWRKAHPNIVQGWWDLQDAALLAVDSPGNVYQLFNNRVSYLCANGWLYCRLPSGRCLHYCNPSIKEEIVTLVNKEGEEYERVQRQVRFYGVDSVTKQWTAQHLYGGSQCENVVSGTARCFLDHAMKRLDKRGYPIILTIHDEILSEAPLGFGSEEEFNNIMSEPPWFALDMPLTVKTFEDVRYSK
jgi:DNA polymerase